MIYINELETKKLPGYSSLFLKSDYNEKIVDICRNLQDKFYHKKSKEWEIPINQLSYLINNLIEIDEIELNLLEEKENKLNKDISDYNFKIKPFDFQIEGVQYGLINSNWILGDDQGLGKSKQVIDLACLLKQRKLINKCMIICGVNSLKYNWVNEIKKHSNESYIILGERKRKTLDKKIIGSVKDRVEDLLNKIEEFFIITNIETLRGKKIIKDGEEIINRDIVEAIKQNINNIDMFVIDEAHKIRNSKSNQGTSILELKDIGKSHITLTGTLILTSPLNAYTSLKFINKEKCSYYEFLKFYCIWENKKIVGYKNLDILQYHISKVMLRRLKSEKLNLPPKTYYIEYVEMGDVQKKFYNSLTSDDINKYDLFDKINCNTLEESLFLRQRQATAYTGILSSTIKESAKLDRLDDLLEIIIAQGDKVLIFCNFKQVVEHCKERYKQYNPLVGTKDYKDEEIEIAKEKFQNDSKYKLFISTWQKMGTGHTLTAASYVIHIDTPLTDGEFQQTSDRAHRIGTEKPVIVITLVTKNTIDEVVLDIVEGRRTLSEYLTNLTKK